MNLSVLTSYNYQTQDSSGIGSGAFGLYVAFFLIAIIVGIIIRYIIAKKFENVAKLKGYGSEMHSFAMCFWLGIIGCIYVAALPKINTKEESDREHGNILIEEGRGYICSKCQTPIPYGTVKCPVCGRAFNWDGKSENE